MNWLRGLFRAWIVFTVIWVAGSIAGAIAYWPHQTSQSSTPIGPSTSEQNLITDFRKKYPQYADLSDEELADRLYRKFYSDLPRPEYDRRIGFSRQPQMTGSAPDIRKHLVETIIFATWPPGALLAAGWALLWIGRGFRPGS